MSVILVSAKNRAFLIAAALALAALALAFVMHGREHADTDIVSVELNPQDPSQTRLGALIYRGGIDIPKMGRNLGGLSALRWDEGSARLLALSDDARFAWITLEERADTLVGLRSLEMGELLGLEGEPLSGKQSADAESLTRSAQGGWLIGFERDHRVWRYPEIDARPSKTDIDPVAIMGPLEANGGTETLAVDERALFLCAERYAPAPQPNCFWKAESMGPSPLRVEPPEDMRTLEAVATDADLTSDATLFVLFRSYDPARGNVIGVVALGPDGAQQDIATIRAPISVDNFEGLAVREDAGRTFIYLVSDDNFSSNQRTLLLKFEWDAPAQ